MCYNLYENMEPKSTEKKVERISKMQKEKLMEYMSSHLEFAREQFTGINSNASFKEQRNSLRVILNSLGGSENTVEQWKKCWIDLKCGVKKTIDIRRTFMNKIGGGSWLEAPRALNPLEEEILQIISTDAVDGDSCTPESGILIEESFEEFVHVEFLECEELYNPPPKKAKETPSKSSQAKMLTSSSKYINALDETKAMQEVVMAKLNRIEKQSQTILDKLE